MALVSIDTSELCIGALERREIRVLSEVGKHIADIRACLSTVVPVANIEVGEHEVIVTTEDEVLPEREEGLYRALRDFLLENN